MLRCLFVSVLHHSPISFCYSYSMFCCKEQVPSRGGEVGKLRGRAVCTGVAFGGCAGAAQSAMPHDLPRIRCSACPLFRQAESVPSPPTGAATVPPPLSPLSPRHPMRDVPVGREKTSIGSSARSHSTSQFQPQ